jgi:hypothetical protein
MGMALNLHSGDLPCVWCALAGCAKIGPAPGDRIRRTAPVLAMTGTARAMVHAAGRRYSSPYRVQRRPTRGE